MRFKLRHIVAGLALTVVMLMAVPIMAGMSSANYQIPNDVISGGGSAMSSANYQLVGTIGQSSPLGAATSTSYTNYPGFWQADECVFDADSDGLFNANEYGLGTNAWDPDTDHDALNDGEEVTGGLDGYTTDPLIADTDIDGLNDGAEFTHSTNPKSSDTDRDGLNDGEEVFSGLDGFTTDPKGWDTDHDALPDKFESDNSIGHIFNLNPKLAADAALDFDGDGIINVHDYWNASGGPGTTGNGVWVADPVGFAACGFWGEADGDGFITPIDKGALVQMVKGIPYNYINVTPPTSETQDLDTDGFLTPVDASLMSAMAKGVGTAFLPSRPVSLQPVSTCLPVMAVGDTCHVSIMVVNSAVPATKQGGISVVFSVDPSSTATATIFGGEGADSGQRYDLSGTALSGPGGLTNVMVRPDSVGAVHISARIPQCGDVMNTGRSCPEILLNNFANITVQ